MFIVVCLWMTKCIPVRVSFIPCLTVSRGSRITELLISTSFVARQFIIRREYDILLVGIASRHSVFILSIDEATTHLVLLHINQVEFDDARYIAIFLMLFRTFFSRQLQEHTGS